jgi:hypothetical protein
MWLLSFSTYDDGSRQTSHAVIEMEPSEYQVSMAIDRDIPHHIECSNFEVFVVLIVRMVEARATPNRWDLFYFGYSGNGLKIMHSTLS